MAPETLSMQVKSFPSWQESFHGHESVQSDLPQQLSAETLDTKRPTNTKEMQINMADARSLMELRDVITI
jgi:hypothetical protein